MTDPSSFFAPARNQARDMISQNYAGVGDRIRQQFAGGGEGASGKQGYAQLVGDLSRRQALGNADNEYATQIAQAPLSAVDMAQRFLGLNFGTKSTGETTTSGSSTGNTSTVGQSSDLSQSTVQTQGESQQDRTSREASKSRNTGFNLGF